MESGASTWAAWAALILFLLGVVAAFGVRTWLHYRATGDTGNRQLRSRPGSVSWWATVLMVVGTLAGVAAPVLALTGAVTAAPAWWQPVIAVAGGVVAVTGFAGVVATQHAMGASWRIGVDDSERTALVTTGVFGLVRNPVFTAMLTAYAGIVAMVPTPVAALGLACAVAGVELQVRAVEEPYLTGVHGAAYTDYTARVGRFLPGLGRTAVPRQSAGSR